MSHHSQHLITNHSLQINYNFVASSKFYHIFGHWGALTLQYLGDIFLLAPLKPGDLWRKRHELDSPNQGGHLPHHPTSCYNLPLKNTDTGCGLQG
ncbi:hypothetical protein AVEN_169604-1 [Araneus ventricosus]|uniref:Uncharacterized protein n=1 Tax=Araneus ventricosus TaxID=182803 RepID=A0A4Y2HPW7_ARAVE|nr:hypothetical protein AVEN_169604-1 [Araneus ventricosus]